MSNKVRAGMIQSFYLGPVLTTLRSFSKGWGHAQIGEYDHLFSV